MENVRLFIDPGFVYIAQMINHLGEVDNDYLKIGKTIDVQTREMSLNSTNMPYDVVFIRLFETKYMSSLEKILHTGHHEIRVSKKKETRKNTTTEWFWVKDKDMFDFKVDNIIRYFPETREIDIVQRVQSDTGTTVNQKTEIINAVSQEKRKRWKLNATINGDDFTSDLAKETFADVFEYICSKVGYDEVCKVERNLSLDKEFFIKRHEGWKSFKPETELTQIGDYYLMVGFSNPAKKDIIDRLKKHFNLTEIECWVEQMI